MESRHSLKAPEWRQCAKELDPNTLILGVELLGRKRGIFVLAAYAIVKEGSAMNMLATGQPSQEITRSRRIGFLIYPDCEICDVCGPFDAFHWADYWLPRFGRTDEPGYQLIILAATPGPVRTLGGIEIVATHSFCDIGHGLDTLLVAGGCLSVDQACKDPSLVEWVRSAGPRVRRVASICTGALILAAAGLLDHRRVTTHWMFSDMLASEYPSIQVDPSLFFARDGNIYTSGGVTAGIDLAMALVEEESRPGNCARGRPDDGGFPPALRRAIPVQKLSDGRRKKPARHPRTARLDPGAPQGGSQRSRTSRSHGHEPAQFRAALSRRDGTDAGRICRTGAR